MLRFENLRWYIIVQDYVDKGPTSQSRQHFSSDSLRMLRRTCGKHQVGRPYDRGVVMFTADLDDVVISYLAFRVETETNKILRHLCNNLKIKQLRVNSSQ